MTRMMTPPPLYISGTDGEFTAVERFSSIMNFLKKDDPEMASKILLSGNIDIVNLALENGFDLTPKYQDASYALAEKNVDILEWIVNQGYFKEVNFPYQFSSFFAEINRLDLIKTLEEQGCKWRHPSVCYKAAASGNLDLLKWVVGMMCPWNECAHSEALKYDHADVAKWVEIFMREVPSSPSTKVLPNIPVSCS